MSLRVLFFLLLVLGFSWYAYRNWFTSLCAAVVLMAFMKHHDMPRGLLGIPGMNMWNLLIVNVVIAWWIQRRHEGSVLEFPRGLKIALWLYLIAINVACLRLALHPTNYFGFTATDVFIEFILNSMRFLIPALLFYDGCRTRERIRMALGVIVVLYFLLAVQTIRYMGFHPDFNGNELSGRAARIIQKSVGYDRVDMSMMLAGGSWAAIAFSRLIEKKWLRWGVCGVAAVILFGQALTGGRAGYVTWGITGLVLCTLKWRKLLPLVPLAAVLVVVFVPGVAERMFSGFGGDHGGIVVEKDESEITSGRNLVWPVVIKQIEKAPLFGYGRGAMMTTGLAAYVADAMGDSFPHPHEAYLEAMLDSGIIGFLCIIPIYLVCLKRSVSLFMDRTDVLYEAAGGVAMALLLGLLLASFGAQTLYPRESAVGMWAALGVAMRLSMERERQRETEDDDVEFAEPTVDTDGMPYADSGHETMAGI
ncbi:MAG TPA: O-antigen ligase family protein [Verrucomicrobiae bacterium]|nr:O-antigen ligase family protein [Verrucomicrobiae bacterium]